MSYTVTFKKVFTGIEQDDEAEALDEAVGGIKDESTCKNDEGRIEEIRKVPNDAAC